MAEIRKFWKSLAEDEGGATMVEYGLMLALIAVVCIGAVALVGTEAEAVFDHIATELGGALGGGGGTPD